MTRKAVYAGSFDPPTNGHLWMIQQASRLFDEVVVAVGTNPQKRSSFPTDIRLAMFRDMTHDLSNISVGSLGSMYLVDFAANVGADYMLRGIRNGSDVAFEAVLRHINADIARRAGPTSAIESVFLMPPRELIEVSSSMVKSLVGPTGWERTVAAYVPPHVLARLIGRRHHWLWEQLVHAGARGEEDAFWVEGLMPYAVSGRHHHGMPHVSEVLTELEGARDLLADPAVVGFAAVCHDAVLDCSRDDNEERSAEFARNFAHEFGMPGSFGDTAAYYVLATKDHRGENTDAKILNDADMAVLGYGPVRFDEYERGIEREYLAMCSAQEYRAGRIKWISNLLNESPDHIYDSPYFEQRFGAQARVNLLKSLGSLRCEQ